MNYNKRKEVIPLPVYMTMPRIQFWMSKYIDPRPDCMPPDLSLCLSLSLSLCLIEPTQQDPEREPTTLHKRRKK